MTIYIDMPVIKYVITECYREEDRFLEIPRVPKVFQEYEILYGNIWGLIICNEFENDISHRSYGCLVINLSTNL